MPSLIKWVRGRFDSTIRARSAAATTCRARPSEDDLVLNLNEQDLVLKEMPSGYKRQLQYPEVRLYLTPMGDPMVVYHLRVPPRLPDRINSLKDLCPAAVSMAMIPESPENVEVVDFWVGSVSGAPAYCFVIKTPASKGAPLKATYVGSVIIPFRHASLAVKLEADEPAESAGADDASAAAAYPEGHPVPRIKHTLKDIVDHASLSVIASALEPFPVPFTVADATTV